MNFVRITFKNNPTKNKLDFIKYMIEKYSNIIYLTKDKFSYTFELEDSLSDFNMEKIVSFWYDNFEDEVFFENSSNTISSDDTDIMLDSLSKFMHNTMMKEKISNGWRYGEKFSMEDKTSPLLVPYEQLPKEHQVQRPDIFKKVLELIS